MTEDVPATLQPPVPLALAKAVESVPAETALPGGSVYEPKWDGFRACALVGAGGVTLWSRQGKELSRYFPELLEALAGQVPPGCVLDGEAVVWSFDAPQRRLVTSRAALHAVARDRPASFVAFDLLAVAGHDIRDTHDRTQALTWFEELHHAGLEGLVVKGAGQSYQGGARQWIKVKRRQSLDVVCAAVIGRMDRPQYVVAGLPVEGRLRIVGRSTPLAAMAARNLAEYLHPPQRPHPWPEVITETMLNRFSKDKGPVALSLVAPMVVEISADAAWTGNAFRHSIRYIRPRPELDPENVQLPGW